MEKERIEEIRESAPKALDGSDHDVLMCCDVYIPELLAEVERRGKYLKKLNDGFLEQVDKNESLRTALQTAEEQVKRAIEFGFEWGGFDGGHHKMWTIDQMLRILCGNDYEEKVREAKDGEDGPDTYGWDEGIAP